MSDVNFNITDAKAGTGGGGGGGTSFSLTSYSNTMTGDKFTVSAAFSNTAGGGMAQVGSVQLNNVIISSLTDVLELRFSALQIPSATADLLIGYQIGANPAVWGTYLNDTTLMAVLNESVTGITPGTYTVKLMACKSGTGTVDIGASDSTTYGDGNIPAGAVFTGRVFSTSAGTGGGNGSSTPLLGDSTGATPATGYVGEMLSHYQAGSATTGSAADINTLTLTPGTWEVSASLYHDNNGGVSGANIWLYAKGANSGNGGQDFLLTRSVPAGSYSFNPRIVTIAAGDADKTIKLKAQAVGASGDYYSYISAIRTAPLGNTTGSTIPDKTTTAFTPTTNFSNATCTGFYSITNGIMRLDARVKMTGSAGTPGNFYLDITSSGYKFDTSKMTAAPDDDTPVNFLAQVYMGDHHTANMRLTHAMLKDANSFYLYYGNTTSYGQLTGQVAHNAPWTWATDDYISIQAIFPVTTV